MIKTILVVDDNQPNRELLKVILNHAHYNVLEAADGAAGILCAKENKPDIIFMDIQLPVMDGTEAMRILKNTPETAHIPIIAFTSYAMKNDKEKMLSLGFEGYIAKPINIDEVIGLLQGYKKND